MGQSGWSHTHTHTPVSVMSAGPMGVTVPLVAIVVLHTIAMPVARAHTALVMVRAGARVAAILAATLARGAA